jgi:hypothetical protein
MDLPQIAFQEGWRDLVSPSLLAPLYALEEQGIVFSWALSAENAYVFSSWLPVLGKKPIALCSWDGSEMPRQAISEVIVGTMSARGSFGSLSQTRNRLPVEK